MSAIHSYKALQSNLRHLAWKTQLIAEGDLEQEVDFMGDFSVAFNTMTSQLREAFETIAERNETLRLANVAIGEEREKSERLLLNILPAKVAEELKRSGRSEPQMFEEVTVFFSDVVGFASLSSKLSPIEIIDELNTLYTRFDEIIDAHGCERIKTIGDAYLAVCGMPRRDDDHAKSIVSAAAEIMQYIKKGHRGQRSWKIRVGIHSGPVVGGIVGVKKYIYDVFGDTINIASRMESSSEPMRINVSEATWRLVRDQFTFIDRGINEVKGIGPTKMFFLDVA
jgi:class 3 adenylate cyclase